MRHRNYPLFASKQNEAFSLTIRTIVTTKRNEAGAKAEQKAFIFVVGYEGKDNKNKNRWGYSASQEPRVRIHHRYTDRVAKRQAVRFVFRNDWAIYWTQPLIRIEMVFTPFSSPRTNESWFTFLSISPSSKGNKVKCIAFYGGSKSQLLIFYDRCMPSRQYLFVASILKHMNRIHMSSESDSSCEIVNDSVLQAVPTVH